MILKLRKLREELILDTNSFVVVNKNNVKTKFSNGTAYLLHKNKPKKTLQLYISKE
jgi:hypothetical protein